MDSIQLTAPIIRIDTDEISIRYKWEDDASKLNPNIQIVSVNDYNDLVNSKSNSLILPRNATTGSILMRHPFRKNTYIPLEEAEMTIYKDKMFCMSSIAVHLGLLFDWKVELVSVSKRDIDASGNIDYKNVKVDATFKSNEEEKYRGMISMTQDVRQNPISTISSEEEYQEACDLVKKYGLENDMEIISLLDGRKPNCKHIISDRTISVELSKEVNSMYDIAYSLNVLHGLFGFSASLNEKVSQNKTLKLVLHLHES